MPIPLLALLPFAISSTINAVSGSSNAAKNRNKQSEVAHFNAKQQEKLVNLRQKMQCEQMKKQYLQHQENLAFQTTQSQLNRVHQDKLEAFRLDFQAKQSALSREHQAELETFRQTVNMKINERNLDFQAWRWEKEQILQSQLATYNRETQQLLAHYQRETTLKLPEVNKLFETWPLNNVPFQILKAGNHHGIPPLKVIIAPPVIDFDKFDKNTHNNIPKLEKRLEEKLRQFFSQYYPLNDVQRPVEFLGGEWNAKRFHGESSIKALFSMLNSETILVIESEIDDDRLNIRFAYWTAGEPSYHYTSVVTGFRYLEPVYESAKKRARKWQVSRDLLLQAGENPNNINALDTYNLEILEKEARFVQLGIDVSKLPPRYKLQNSDFETLNQFLQLNHCLVAGLVSDSYHLLQHDTAPILPYYLQKLSAESLSSELIASIIENYRTLLTALQKEKPVLVSEIAIDLALGFAKIKEKKGAELFLIDSMNYWLKGHGLATSNNIENAVISVSDNLNSNDADYAEKLKTCLIKIEHSLVAQLAS